MFSLKQSFSMMAGYNRWANRHLYAAAAELSSNDFEADRGVFFHSMEGTLNHLLATDRIWMRRLTGGGEAPDRLDAILHEDLAALRAARDAEDERIVAYVEAHDDASLSDIVVYSPLTKPGRIEQPAASILVHLFNHQTHHRGQAHAILTGFGRAAPSLDLILFQRETGIGL